MTTKMMTMAAALALGASAFAATPQEMINAEDWDAFAKLPQVQFTNYLAKANIEAVYSACLANTNYTRCSQMAILGYVDKAKAFRDTYAIGTSANDIDVVSRSLWARTYLFEATTNNEWRAEILKQYSDTGDALATKKTQNRWSVVRMHMFNFLVEHEAEAIEIANYALSKKDYRTASALLIYPYPKPEGATQWVFTESETLKAWRLAHAKEIMDGLKEYGDWSLYDNVIFGLFRRDLMADDKDSSYVMQFFDASVWKDDKVKVQLGGNYLVDWEFGRAQYNAYMKNSTDAVKIWRTCIGRLPIQNRIAEIKKWWTKLAVDPFVAREAAIFIKDNDKLLDALVASTEKMTVAQINDAIEMVVAFDADYRADDVMKVLKNINSKYTLKLYDDRDTWEPILSKIRALIDTRL